MKPVVKIAWLDACSASGWRTEPTPPTANYTVGYEVHHCNEFIEVACTYDPMGEHWNGSISIPKDNVITYDIIEEGYEETKDLKVEITFEHD